MCSLSLPCCPLRVDSTLYQPPRQKRQRSTSLYHSLCQGNRRVSPVEAPLSASCSVVNVSAMSYGSLSARAIESLNKGSFKFGNYPNTGEGGLSPYHKYGADVVFNMGTSYLACGMTTATL